MNREEVIGGIAELLQEPDVQGYDWSIGSNIIANWKASLPARILIFFEQSGYRLIPELKMLSDEEMKKINDDMPPEAKYGDVFQAIAQAQRDYDQEQCKE